MIDNLLMADPADVTPQRAGAVFSKSVHDMVKSEGMAFAQAWNKAKTMHPELFARMCNQDQAQAATVAAPAQNPYIPYANKAMVLEKFGMPADTNDELFAAAWHANKAQYGVVDSPAIFLALQVIFAMARKVTVAVARRMVQEEFPKLAANAGQALGQ